MPEYQVHLKVSQVRLEGFFSLMCQQSLEACLQDLICLLIDVSKLVATYIAAHFHSSLLWLAQSTTIKKRSMDTQTGTMTANPHSLGWLISRIIPRMTHRHRP